MSNHNESTLVKLCFHLFSIRLMHKTQAAQKARETMS